MRSVGFGLALLAALMAGCRSTGGAGRAGTPALWTESALEADKIEPSKRLDELERWERKVIGIYARQKARRDAAQERNRAIDRDPIQRPPQPPAAEDPPK